MSQDIQNFIQQGALKITPAAIAQLEQQLPMVLAKINEADTDRQPNLSAQAQLLVRFVEDCLEQQYQPADLNALTEAIFALIYLYRGTDIIPDEVPEIGYEDDSMIVRTVLTTHREELSAYCKKTGGDFSEIPLEP